MAPSKSVVLSDGQMRILRDIVYNVYGDQGELPSLLYSWNSQICPLLGYSRRDVVEKVLERLGAQKDKDYVVKFAGNYHEPEDKLLAPRLVEEMLLSAQTPLGKCMRRLYIDAKNRYFDGLKTQKATAQQKGMGHQPVQGCNAYLGATPEDFSRQPRIPQEQEAQQPYQQQQLLQSGQTRHSQSVQQHQNIRPQPQLLQSGPTQHSQSVQQHQVRNQQTQRLQQQQQQAHHMQLLQQQQQAQHVWLIHQNEVQQQKRGPLQLQPLQLRPLQLRPLQLRPLSPQQGQQHQMRVMHQSGRGTRPIGDPGNSPDQGGVGPIRRRLWPH